MANNYYSGQGSLYIAERNEATGRPLGFLAVGNVPELTINIETTKIEHKESETGSRLVDLTLVTEKKGTFEFVLENLNLENLAMGLWGSKATVAGDTVAAEVITASKNSVGMRYPLANPQVSAVTVNGSGGTPTYTVTTDYTVDAKNGVISIVPGGAIATALAALVDPATTLDLEVDYTYGGYIKVDAFTQAQAPTRWLRFEGINTVDGSTVIVDMFKAQFDPLTGYGLINEELGSVTMAGSVLADALQPGDSKFFRQVNVDA